MWGCTPFTPDLGGQRQVGLCEWKAGVVCILTFTLTSRPAGERKWREEREREWGHTQTAHERTNETLPPSGIRRKHVFKGRQEFHGTVGIQKRIFTMCDSLKNPVVHRAEGLLPESENGVHVYAVAKPRAPGSQCPLFTHRATTPKEPVSPVLVQTLTSTEG